VRRNLPARPNIHNKELEMNHPSPESQPAGHNQLLHLIANPASINVAQAACIGIDPDVYHPDGDLDDISKARCATCPARTPCLALALVAEEPDARAGWYGGHGPHHRDQIAAELGIGEIPADKAHRLRAAGLTVNQIAARLCCSRRTVQRYLSGRPR
jgi:Transcription factor WhiB/Homeodomain-like domain